MATDDKYLISLRKTGKIHSNYWFASKDQPIILIEYQKNMNWFTLLRNKPLKLVIKPLKISKTRKTVLNHITIILSEPYITVAYTEPLDEYGFEKSIEFEFYGLADEDLSLLPRNYEVHFNFKNPLIDEVEYLKPTVIKHDKISNDLTFSSQPYIKDSFTFYSYDPADFADDITSQMK